MSDGIKGNLSEIASEISESVVKPVVDEVGKAIEEGATTIISGPPTTNPTQNTPQRLTAGEQQKKQWAQRVIEYYRKLEEDLRKVREARNQKLLQSQQEDQQTKQVKQLQVEEKQAKGMSVVQRAQRKTELKHGVGG